MPTDCRDLAATGGARTWRDSPRSALNPSTVVKLIERCDGLRRPERFAELLDACACDFHGRPGNQSLHYAPREILRAALGAVRDVDAGAIARLATQPTQIAQRVHEARVAAVKALAGQDSQHPQ